MAFSVSSTCRSIARSTGLTEDGRRKFSVDYLILPPMAGGAPTYDDQIDLGTHDGFEAEDPGTMSIVNTQVYCLSHSAATSRRWSAIIFDDGPFPATGATITAAYVEVYLFSASYANANFDIYAQLAASPAVLTTTPLDITSRPRTTASAAWVQNSIPLGWAGSSISLVSVIQEVVNSYSPTAICIIFKPRTNTPKNFAFRSYETSPVGTLGAKLHLEWTEGGAQTLTPAAVAVPVDPVAPVVAVGGVTIAPSVVEMGLAVPVHQLSLGTTTLTPAAVVVPVDPVAPTVSVGGVTLAPAPIDVGVNVVPATVLAPGGGITLQPAVTLEVVADSGDGEVVGISGSYATARSTATGHTANATFGNVGQDDAYQVQRVYLKFDTSAIPDDATITKVNMRLVCTGDTSFADYAIEIVKADWSASDPITAGNRDTIYDLILTGTFDKTWRTTVGISIDTPYTSPNLDPSWVSKTGSTYYGLRSSRDFAGITPTGNEVVAIALSEHATAAYRPTLIVQYVPTTVTLTVPIDPVAPTISVGAVTLTPSPAVAPFVVPTHTLINTAGATLSPAPVVVPLDPVAPTVATGAVTLSPAAVVVPIDPVAPTFTVEKTLTPAAVVVPVDPVAPTLVVAITLTPAAVVVPVDPVAPTLVLATTITAPVASTDLSVLAVNAIVIGTVTLTPAAVAMTMEVPLHVIVGTGADAFVAFGKITRLIDPRDYPGSAQFYFEAVIMAGDPAHPCRCYLYNVTDGAVVSSSEVTTTAMTATRVRSSALTLTAASKEYRADFGGIAGGTFKCYAADVLVEVNA